MPNPLECFTKLILLQADLIYNCFVTLFSPIFCFLSIVSESYRRAEETKDAVESTVRKVPSTIAHGIAVLMKKLSFGFLGAMYACMVLTVLLVVAAVVGVGLVELWVEHPIYVREKLYFDYTEAHPKAVFCLGNVGVERFSRRKQLFMGVPRGHEFHVSLVLLMPESDFNRKIGVFQLSAELLSIDGAVIAKSSQPCMLRFRSFPIRLARTVLLFIPLLLGISSETQKMTIDILKHTEGIQRTKAVRATLVPSAGTSSVPQLYETEILIHSQPPWTKELVRNWKWTFYVWTSLYVYITLLMVLLFCCKKLFLPMAAAATLGDGKDQEKLKMEEPAEISIQDRDEREMSEFLRKWKQRRSKRKAVYLHEAMPESTFDSSKTSISVTREGSSSTLLKRDVGDSESVCLGGN
ncbi:LOW QUALITY PROTEIN: seipin-1 [Juglans microcarpa x Juglans regia]|uniref:LOW QUALITY PROTEIN: seipin-1 n=1 Tax=Juglans microcarpa x Juglans regia TaxID=2249226 RepID=UPI001B7F2BE6|nr:LOW QUALITY PROTEIN: seipin-1 [Juglans microcarpa x Juglans regia]